MTPTRVGGEHDDGADPEFRILVHCAGSRSRGAAREAIRKDAARVRDWDRLLVRAERHGVLPLLARRLPETEPALAPPGVLDRLRSLSLWIARQNLLRIADLLRIVEALEAAGIESVSFKGPVEAIRVYGNVGLRVFGDLDILVPEDRVLRALEALEELGYEPHPGAGWHPSIADHVFRSGNEISLLDRDRKRMMVDLHWRLFPARYRRSLEETGLYERLDDLTLGGRRVRCLSVEDRLLYLVHHGFRHGWVRLEWLCGVAETMRADPEMEWEEIVDRARWLGMTRALASSLALAGSVLDVRVPEAIAAEARRPPIPSLVRSLRSVLTATDENSARFPPLLEARGLDRHEDRVWLVASLVATPTPADWRSVSLRGAAAPAYYGVRIVRLGFKRLVSWIRAAWRRRP